MTTHLSELASGESYYRARYYNPTLQRFISEDPIQISGGINPYKYVLDDPMNLQDPSGLCPSKDPCEVPKHPWYASVDVNMLESEMNGPAFQFLMVLPHMPWDYKQQGPYDDFGNFNFGATGAALGYSDEALLRGAGGLKVIERVLRKQQIPPDLGSPLGNYPYGNERDKQEMIMRGIEYFKNGCWILFKMPF